MATYTLGRSHVKNIFRDIPVVQQVNVKKRGRSTLKHTDTLEVKPYKKKPIPVAVREATWVLRCGRVFEHKCLTTWCPNTLTVFEFQSGHDIPESKGGATCPENLYPICARCNTSMGNRYTFKEWCDIQKSAAPALQIQATPHLQEPPPPVKARTWRRYFQCFRG